MEQRTRHCSGRNGLGKQGDCLKKSQRTSKEESELKKTTIGTESKLIYPPELNGGVLQHRKKMVLDPFVLADQEHGSALPLKKPVCPRLVIGLFF